MCALNHVDNILETPRFSSVIQYSFLLYPGGKESPEEDVIK